MGNIKDIFYKINYKMLQKPKTKEQMFEGGKLEEEKCCICIPIETGMKIMAILSMIGGVLCLISAIGVITSSLIGGIIFLIFCAWPLYVAFVWYKWFKVDDLENTEKVVCTMKCQLVVVLVLVALMCVMVIINIAEVG